MKTRIIFIVIALLVFTMGANAQVVKGKVIDAATGAPIAHASIYLNGSSKGTISNTEGDFILNTNETKIPLVVSYIGYQSETINDYTNKALTVKLSPRATVLREVVIGGMSREEQMKIFLTQFIGSTNVTDCYIENPDDINFSYHKKTKTLEADISQPLIINNKKLGYKITYFLSSFSHSLIETYYSGNYVFKEDTIGLKPADMKKILKARDRVYFGSRMHFIRSLWANDLEKNKLALNNATAIDPRIYPKNDKSLYKDVVKIRDGEKFLLMPQVLAIRFKNDNSFITLENKGIEVLITSNGYHTTNLVWSGKMSEQRVNALLPFEFEPLEPLSDKKIPEEPTQQQQVSLDTVQKRMIVKQNVFTRSHKPEKLYVLADKNMSPIINYNTTHLPERIFVSTDKWNYAKEDTIWFKTYVFDANLTSTTRSGLMYVEIVNANNVVVSRNMVSLNNGLGWGNIALKADRYPEGTYTMRAYTNWMLNFGQRDIFNRQFNIDGALDDEKWMINSRYELAETEGVNKVKTSISINKEDGKPVLLEDIQVRVLDRLWKLNSAKLNTGIDGKLEFDFNLPPKTKINDVNIELTKKTKKQENIVYTVPVIINRDEKADMKFMPEGGNMVVGINGRIGFKAINEEGQGVDVSGGIYNGKGVKLTDITSTHKGMGSFDLKPELNEKYTARINYKGKQLNFKLPEAKTTGMVMNIDNATNKDSIIITVTASDNIKQAAGIYYLIAQARNKVCFDGSVNTAKGVNTLRASKAAFPTGIARFTLISQQHQPITERIVFVDHHDQIKLSITPSKTIYANRDSVTLEITATDKNGAPMQGAFSLAVTDDLQARPDTSGYYDIPAKVLLADDLKGNIESPGWYFAKGNTQQKAAALDALMLTQGWVSYDWKEVFAAKQKPLTHNAEPEFVIKGRVVNAFNMKLKKTDVFLKAKNSTTILLTETDEDGKFAFTGLTPVDTIKYSVEAKHKAGGSFNIRTELEEFIPPVLTSIQQRQVPLYLNIDTSRLVAIRTKQLYDAEEERVLGNKLKDVVIKAKKVIRGSRNLNGDGESDLAFNTQDIAAMSKVTLLDILKKVPGFEMEERYKEWGYFTISGKFPIIIIDGVPANYSSDGLSRYQLLNYVYNDDIKGIEVMTEIKKVEPYAYKFSSAPPGRVCAIEITTYSGQGIFQKPPGVELYQPPIFAAKKEFYSPLYTVKTPNIGVDVRSTIFWAPNVVTNEKGKATIGFYTADKTATYTVNIQGADMEGQVGSQQSKLSVKAGTGIAQAK